MVAAVDGVRVPLSLREEGGWIRDPSSWHNHGWIRGQTLEIGQQLRVYSAGAGIPVRAVVRKVIASSADCLINPTTARGLRRVCKSESVGAVVHSRQETV